MKKLVFISLLLVSQIAIAQENETDYTLARVGEKIYGVYVFVNATPIAEYDYIATVKIRVNWSGTTREAFQRAISKAKNKYPNFNGMIFRGSGFDEVDLIKFKGLEITGGGFAVGDKVLYVNPYAKTGEKSTYGKIVSLKNQYEAAEIEYLNEYGEKEIKQIKYTKLSPVSDKIYEEKIRQELEEISKHQFEIGDSVYWEFYIPFQDNYIEYGEVVTLDDRYHKATVKYISPEGEEKITDVFYLKLFHKED